MAATDDPDLIFRRISHCPYPVYLWGQAGHERGRYSILAHSPFAILRPRGAAAELRAGTRRLSLAADGVTLAAGLARELTTPHSDLPFSGGVVGYVTYEWAQRYVDLALPADGPLPAYHFAFYDQAYVYDHERRIGRFTGSADRFLATSAREECTPAGRLGAWSASVGERDYFADVARILEHIKAGDIYQANYTGRFSAAGHVDGPTLAQALKARNPSPMGAYLSYPFGTIWSCSPERLLRGIRQGEIESAPIKGTRPREHDPVLDDRARDRLLSDPKERAELLMIVDLVRHDFGRVAATGSVEVNDLYRVESYANVHHLEARVSARMDAEVGWAETLAALLPGGSVTGAPKRRAAEILRGLERAPRSVYTGALGYFSFDGRADFSLPIRTLYHDGRRFHLHSGGGIVADSDPAREYEELLLKVANIRTIVDDVCHST